MGEIVPWNVVLVEVICKIDTASATCQGSIYVGPFTSKKMARRWISELHITFKKYWSPEGYRERALAAYGETVTGDDGSTEKLDPVLPGNVILVATNITSESRPMAKHYVWEVIINPKLASMDEVLEQLPLMVARNVADSICGYFGIVQPA